MGFFFFLISYLHNGSRDTEPPRAVRGSRDLGRAVDMDLLSGLAPCLLLWGICFPGSLSSSTALGNLGKVLGAFTIPPVNPFPLWPRAPDLCHRAAV